MLAAFEPARRQPISSSIPQHLKENSAYRDDLNCACTTLEPAYVRCSKEGDRGDLRANGFGSQSGWLDLWLGGGA